MSGVAEDLVAIVVAVVLGALAWRRWQAPGVVRRVILGGLTTLLTLVVALVALVGLVGVYRLYTPHGGPAPAGTYGQSVSQDQVDAAGRRANGCAGCHSTTGTTPLDGGERNFLAGPLGRVYAPNLTPGGPLGDWTDGQIARAIREGVDKDGHPLIIMPADAFHHLADADVQALVAYLRSQPPVSHPTASRDLSLMALVLVGGGLFPTVDQPPITSPQIAPPAAVTPEYGKYLLDSTGCQSCHGATLQGGKPGGFGPPAGPNIVALVGTWPEAAFITFFRTGVDAYGRTIDPQVMPWKEIGMAYTDDQLRAMYAYFARPGS